MRLHRLSEVQVCTVPDVVLGGRKMRTLLHTCSGECNLELLVVMEEGFLVSPLSLHSISAVFVKMKFLSPV